MPGLDVFQVNHPIATIVIAVGIWVLRGVVLYNTVDQTLTAMKWPNVEGVGIRIRLCCRWWVGLAFVMGWLF